MSNTVYILMLRPPAVAVERPDAVTAWVRNVRAEPRVTVRLGRRTFTGHVREVTAESELATARSALCDRVHLTDYGEYDLHMRGLPSRDKIKALHRYWFDTGIPFAIDIA
jgi:F420H(2)-dependent quinone reductase